EPRPGEDDRSCYEGHDGQREEPVHRPEPASGRRAGRRSHDLFVSDVGQTTRRIAAPKTTTTGKGGKAAGICPDSARGYSTGSCASCTSSPRSRASPTTSSRLGWWRCSSA